MKQALHLQVSQQLSMTPQLQQAIRLLQLSSVELQKEIQAALDANPMLEGDEGDDGEPDDDGAPAGEDGMVDPIGLIERLGDTAGTDEQETGTRDLDMESDRSLPDDLPVDSAWEDVFEAYGQSSAPADGPSGDSADEQDDTSGESLSAQLLWQLNLTPMSDIDRAVAFAIIESLDNDGYLTAPLEEIRDAVLADDDIRALLDARPLEPGEDNSLGLDEIVAVLHRIQQFDPVGVAARNLRECLLIQLKQHPANTPWREEAITLVSSHLELLARRDHAALARRLSLSTEDLSATIRLVRSLNPRPGGSAGSAGEGYVIPDAIVRRDGNRWRVELNPDALPRLRIHPAYAALARDASRRQDGEYLRNHLQEARWLLKSLKARNETLLKVATRIVEVQKDFLDQGPEGMKPLVLADVASAIGMHESTVSRITTEKYLLTPRGMFELKYFFSSHVGTASGGECSSTAIRAIIKKLISAENPRIPLSDSQIAEQLVAGGMNVARRTVAKYRESLNIPSSSERKQLF